MLDVPYSPIYSAGSWGLYSVFAPKLELGLCHCDKIFNNNNQKNSKIYFKKVSSDAQVWSTAHHGGKQGAGAEQRSHCVRSQEAEMNAAAQPTFFFLFSSFYLLRDSGP